MNMFSSSFEPIGMIINGNIKENFQNLTTSIYHYKSMINDNDFVYIDNIDDMDNLFGSDKEFIESYMDEYMYDDIYFEPTIVAPTILDSNITDCVIKIQKWFRGYRLRLLRLPLIMYKIQDYLKRVRFQCSNINSDGRINSCIDEDNIIKLLVNRFPGRIITPKIRMWYDICVFDNIHGWIVVNIKTTTAITSDNTGNLAMCVHAYTDEVLNIEGSRYENGAMHGILFEKIRDKKINRHNKKDYYFIVVNKTDTSDIIINSVKGLTVLTPNINNLPFQVCWNKNRIFKYRAIRHQIKSFINILQRPKPSWKERFMMNMRSL